MVLATLGASEDHVVIRDDHGLGDLWFEEVAIYGGHAADHAVGRGVVDQILQLTATTLGGNDQRPVFDEAVFVYQVGNVLSGGALIAGTPFRNSFRTAFVVPLGMAVADLGQVSSFLVCIYLAFVDNHGFADFLGNELDEFLALDHSGGFVDQHHADHAGLRCLDRVFHLHRLDDDEFLTLTDFVSGSNLKLPDGSLQRRCN